MPAQHIYRDDDKITWAHETSHGLNSRIRNRAGPGMNAAYVYGGMAIVLKEPPVTLAQVAAAAKQRGRLYDLYLVKQRGDWNDQPLYLVDEMIAYINGAVVGYEWGHPDTVGEHENAVEMYRYVRTLYDLLLPMHPERYDLKPLDELVRRTHEYLTALVPYAGQRVSQVRCGPGGCDSGGQPAWQGGLLSRLQFRRRLPPFRRRRIQVIATVPCPVPVTPDAPLEPIQPPGASSDQIDAINARLDALAAAIAAIPAGRTGDTGQQGGRGLQGEAGPPGEPAQAGQQGPPGSDGARGQDGPPGVFNPATLTDDQVAALAKRLPPLYFQAKTPGPDGELYGDLIAKRLGETVIIRDEK